MRPLEETLGDVVEILERFAVPYMVIGGFANLVWGEPRSTFDIDITVSAEDPAILNLAEALGDVLVNDPSDFVARTRVLPVRHPDGTPIDLIAATLPFEQAAIRRAVTVEIGGRQVHVCSPEDLVVHKVISSRPRDIADVDGIIRRQSKALDLAYLDPIVEGLAVDLEQPEIAERYRAAKAAAGLR